MLAYLRRRADDQALRQVAREARSNLIATADAMSRQPLQTWAARYLDPGSRMTEVLFGLIITLTFTLGAGLVVEEKGRAGARQLLIATASCTLA